MLKFSRLAVLAQCHLQSGHRLQVNVVTLQMNLLPKKQQVLLFSDSPAFNSYNKQVLLVAREMYMHSMIEIVKGIEKNVESNIQKDQHVNVQSRFETKKIWYTQNETTPKY